MAMNNKNCNNDSYNTEEWLKLDKIITVLQEQWQAVLILQQVVPLQRMWICTFIANSSIN